MVGGEGPPRKRTRVAVSSEAGEEECTDLIPSSEVLKDLVSKSFSYGDYFKPWRNRHFRTFALSYTECAVEELLVEFSQIRNLRSVVEIRNLIKEKSLKEIGDIEKKSQSCKVRAEAIYKFAENEVTKKHNVLGLRKYFRVSPNELSNLSLIVPFAKQYLDDDFLKWTEETSSYFEAYKKICGLIQSLNVFKCTSSEEALHVFNADFEFFFQSDDFVDNVLTLNLTIFKYKLEKLLKKKERYDTIFQRQTDSVAEVEKQISLCECELKSMNSKITEITEQNGFLSVLETISMEEKDSFVLGIKRVFQGKYDVVEEKLNTLKRKRDQVNAAFSEEIFGVVGSSGSGMMMREIVFYEQCVSETSNLIDDGFGRDLFLSCVRNQFNEECMHSIKPLCEFVEGGPEFSKWMIKSLSKMISSKEVMLDGLCKIASDLQRCFV